MNTRINTVEFAAPDFDFGKGSRPRISATSLLRLIASEVGARTPRSVLTRLESIIVHLHTARWTRENGYSPRIRVPTREDVIKRIAESIADEEVLYLEFGVYKGESIRAWSQLLKNGASRLHGFDSFEGLPEDWTVGKKKGHFSTQGALPEASDPRIAFYPGWFDQTLPSYEFVDSPVLVIYLDADIYSSTIYVLKTLRPYIKVGSILCLDDFWDPRNVQRAFKEFVAETGIKFEAIVADYWLNNIAFRRVK